ncbi:MAG: phosphate acyltransferase PlsX [Clostridia bacterium]|nr:phosphate acyltransferase PlsX [Clostridia bacterium]MEE1024835.1 phosphate acyltransferase PlsX [Acutalibacteraceae bacterium]
MKIIVDAFGGDNAPLSNVQGAADAVRELGAEVILVGDEEKLQKCAKDNGIVLDGIEIVHAPDVMDIHDDPNTILKSNKNTSLAVAFTLLKEGKGDAVVSAGSTGAILFGATFIVKRMKGIKRPALATVMPTTGRPTLLLDCGANLNCRPEVLYQFGVLGSVYMENVMGIKNPSVGLLNNGSEDTKGGDVLVETYSLLKNSKLNFIGNIEARDVPTGACDVLVADGFAGNIVLKLTEGVASSFMGMIKDTFMKNIITKLCAAVLKPGLRELKKKTDYSEIGGAPLLGISKPVIKAHGSSNAKAIKNAIRQAMSFASLDTESLIGGKMADAE